MTALENVNKKEWTALSKCEGQFIREVGRRRRRSRWKKEIEANPFQAIRCMPLFVLNEPHKPESRFPGPFSIVAMSPTDIHHGSGVDFLMLQPWCLVDHAV